MKILITGGHGFVGKNVAEVLQNSEHKIFSLSRRDGFDLLNYALVEKYLKEIKPEIIINCASHGGSLHYVTEHAAEVIDDNIQMFLNLYRAANKICPEAKIINPISNCSYPGQANIQKESEYWSGPVHESVWSFGNSRRTFVMVSKCYKMQYGIKSINFFVPNAYGPKDHDDPNKTHALNGLIIRMLKAQKNNEPEFEIWGTGKPMREWIYVKDFAKIIADAINIENDQVDPINMAQNTACSILEISEMIKKEIGYEGKIVFNTKYQDGSPIKKMDDELFRSKFPEFKFTDIDEGIKETIIYYKKILKI